MKLQTTPPSLDMVYPKKQKHGSHLYHTYHHRSSSPYTMSSLVHQAIINIRKLVLLFLKVSDALHAVVFEPEWMLSVDALFTACRYVIALHKVINQLETYAARFNVAFTPCLLSRTKPDEYLSTYITKIERPVGNSIAFPNEDMQMEYFHIRTTTYKELPALPIERWLEPPTALMIPYFVNKKQLLDRLYVLSNQYADSRILLEQIISDGMRNLQSDDSLKNVFTHVKNMQQALLEVKLIAKNKAVPIALDKLLDPDAFRLHLVKTWYESDQRPAYPLKKRRLAVSAEGENSL